MATTSIQFSLDRGERQLWAGAPRHGIVCWESIAVNGGAPLFMELWGIPLLVAGGAAWDVSQQPSYEMIPSARQVCERIREAQRAAMRGEG